MTDSSDPVEELLAEFERIKERVEVFGFTYESDAGAHSVFRLNGEIMRERLKQRHESPRGGTVWRVGDEQERPRRVVCVDDGCEMLRYGRWGSGVPFAIEGVRRASLVERYIFQIVKKALDPGASVGTVHYGLGAELRRGGDLAPRMGRDS